MSSKADQSARIAGRGLGEWVAFVCLLVAIIGAAYALYAYSVFQATEAMLAAAILFVAAAQIPGWLGSSPRRVRKPGELADLIKANAALTKDVQVLSQRMDTVMSDVPTVQQEHSGSLAARVEEIEYRLATLDKKVGSRPAAHHTHPMMPTARTAAPKPPSGFEMTPTGGLVQAAFESGAAGLFLQPLVNLTDKSTRAYEATVQLLGPNGKPFDLDAVSGIIRSNGLEIGLDKLLLDKAIRVSTHFRNRGRETSVVCRFSDRSFADQHFLGTLRDSLTHRRDLAGGLFPAVSQGDLALLSSHALEALAALNDLGFQFVMDDLRDLEAKPDILRRAGFGMVRADHSFFKRATPDRDSECLALLARFRQEGVKVIANNLETDADVAELLNGIDAAQGPVFSKPRMVRAELAESGSGNVTAEAS